MRDERLDDLEGAEAAFGARSRSTLRAPRRSRRSPTCSSSAAASAISSSRSSRSSRRQRGSTRKKATLLEVAKIYDGELGNVDEAIDALRRVLELDGADATALEVLSALYRREQRWPDLAGVLAPCDLAPGDAQRIAFQLQIASVHENEIGDDEAAVEAYRTVLGLDDRSVEALAGLERLYTKLDRFAELNRVYERQIARSPRSRARRCASSRSAGIHEKLHDPRAAIEKEERSSASTEVT